MLSKEIKTLSLKFLKFMSLISSSSSNSHCTALDFDKHIPINMKMNILVQSAYVHVSLARITEEDCFPNCKEDCLSSKVPCACALDTWGGEFAYTKEDLLNEDFLNSDFLNHIPVTCSM